MTEDKPTNSEKPEAPPWLIDNITEASKNTRKIYLLYLGFLAYCALTAISTTDRMLVLNEPAHLPIVNVGVPLEGFFIFAPLLAIMTFIYLQFYLQNLNGMKSELEDNYATVNKNRIYPWIVNILDFPQHGFIGFLQKFVVKFALWWSLPSVLIVFALYYVKKHDLWMSYYLGLLPLIATVLVVLFRINYEKEEFRTFIKVNKFGVTMVTLLLIAEIFFMACIIPWSMQGGKYEFLRPWICVDLSYQKLVTEPETDYEGLYWADFSGIHLEGANLASAVLKRADLRKAHLEKANLNKTNLIEADLDSSYLKYAFGVSAILDSASLIGADLSQTGFNDAFFRDASLKGADLQEASFCIAQLQGVDLRVANLKGTDLYGANLQSAELDSADFKGANLMGAYLPWASLTFSNLQNANLKHANLKEANLYGANLQKSSLSYTGFYRADLRFANLQGADLRWSKFLTIEQLSVVKTLYEAQLDSALLKQVEEQYPHLLEPPEEEEEKSSP